MPVLAEPPTHASTPRKVWTREEFEDLDSWGALQGQHLELVEGELIRKMPKKPPHGIALYVLRNWLAVVFGLKLVVQEHPIDVAPEDNPTSEPEPDLIVLARELTEFPRGNPQPKDVRLIAEIAYSTLDFDLTTKAGLYARAGLADYWVLDGIGRRMFVHRDPRDGRYTSVLAYSADESVSPLAAPAASLRVADLFPTVG